MASLRDPLSAYRMWRDLAGPFRRFVLPSPFLRVHATTLRATSTVSVAPTRQSTRLAGAIKQRTRNLPATTGVILDVPLNAGIEVVLSEVTAPGEMTGGPGMSPWAVLIVGRVDAPGAILPTAMLHEWPTHVDLETREADFGNVPRSEHSDWWRQEIVRPVSRPTWFILDSERQREVSRSRLKRQLDNRYRYSSDHLPPADSLRFAGMTDAVLVCGQSVPAPDLEPWIGNLLDDGFPVRIRTCL